ncbi:MAG TPA: signal peptidase I [Polyangiaceae bacterium]|nr:signal peptidase I [Polyangiaceae bacterium]
MKNASPSSALESRRKAIRRVRSTLSQWTGVLTALAGLSVARASLADHYVVPTGSMEPTVRIGDHILVNKAAYGLRVPFTSFWLSTVHAPDRGSVVVVDPPEPGPVLLKRVIGLPGDLIEVRAGRLTINGNPVVVRRERAAELEMEYLGRPHEIRLDYAGGPDFGPSRVPTGKLLVLGDNRGNSRDGRYFGYLDLAALRGRALAVYARSGSLTWQPL